MLRILFIIILFTYSFGYGQNEVVCSVHFLANGKELSEKNNQVLHNNDTIIIKKIRFYISNVRLFKNQKEVWKDANTAYLIGFKDPNLFSFSQSSKIDYDEIKFDIGIGSLTNVSGALAGALDPTKGMYWSWQSGYINFKLEGYKNNSIAKNNLFQFHIGGYVKPFNPLQSFSFKVEKKNKINIIFDVELFLAELNLAEQQNIMRPCKEAVELAKILPKAVYIND